MAHEITEREDGTVEFFTAREKAWHGLGIVTERELSVNEAIKTANLDWTVSKIPITNSLNQVSNEFFRVERDDTKAILGTAGKKFGVLQNTEAFSFIDKLCDEGARITSAGSLFGGRRVFVTALAPELLNLGDDDTVEMYLTVMNAHDGSSALKTIVSPIRVVCNNTLNMALKNNKNVLSLRHTDGLGLKMTSHIDILRNAVKYGESITESFKRLKEIKIAAADTRSTFENILAKVGFSAKSETTFTTLTDRLMEIHETGQGQDLKNVKGTAWGIYNAWTYYTSHEKAYKNLDSKFESLMQGQSMQYTTTVFNELILR